MSSLERKPTKYRTKVELPEDFKQFMQALQGVAAVIKINDETALVEFEVGPDTIPDEYELGVCVKELSDTLASIIGQLVTIERPTKLEE